MFGAQSTNYIFPLLVRFTHLQKIFDVVQTKKNGELHFEDWSEQCLLVVWFSSLGGFVTQGP